MDIPLIEQAKIQAQVFMKSAETVKVGEAVIEFVVDGAGDTVVLLPCGGVDATYFAGFARRLAEAGFRAVAVNPRGAGKSVGPLDGLTLHTFASDVAAVIERLNGPPVHVIGHGFSNRIARCLGADRPDLVRTLVLLAGVGDIEPTDEVVKALRAWFRHDATESECLEVMRCEVADSAQAERILHELNRWPAAAMAQLAANRATHLSEYAWEASRAPILVVQGLADHVAPPEQGRALRDRLGDRVRLVEIPRAGHMIVLEQPEAVARAVVAYLREPGA